MVANFLSEKLEQLDFNEINNLCEKLRAYEISSNKISKLCSLI